ncbi:MAG: XRE family transcriptional regulator [Spirochaetia bacterium]|jgi:transcriptional regulator with XRE-family HTH domain|nr:XRE family transcriptional regulator [Spirochaetia bacterium]
MTEGFEMEKNRIREARKRKGYTLAQVAEQTGYTVGFLSQLERNLKQPSLNTLRKIAACLECSEVWLITGETEEKNTWSGKIIKKEQEGTYCLAPTARLQMHMPELSTKYEILTPSNLPGDKKAKMTGLYVQLDVGCWASEKMISHCKMDESLFILQGKIDMHIDDEVFPMGVGDCAYVPENTLHNYQNTGDVVMIGIIYFSSLIY